MTKNDKVCKDDDIIAECIFEQKNVYENTVNCINLEEALKESVKLIN